MKSCKIKVASLLLGIAVAVPAASADDIKFFDDFELGLGQWVGLNGGVHHGEVVNDPLQAGYGKVLSFSDFGSGGDLFSSCPIECDGPLTISFDYLGLAKPLSVPGDLGGFLGIAYSLYPVADGEDIFWYAGTMDSYPGLMISLSDDGAWHHYEIALEANVHPRFRVTVEDFAGSGGRAGDIYFDNLLVQCANTPVPEPTVAGMAVLGLGAAIAARRRKS